MSALGDTIDGALEWSVVGSFTRVGAAVRRRVDHWEAAATRDLSGRVVVVTGATSGIGRAAALALARAGASVEIVGRDGTRTAAAAEALREESRSASVGHVVANTGDLEAVRRAAAELLARHSRIDVLIHNAGALDDVRGESPQGIEQTVASQVVGPFLLTALLLPALEAAGPARVLWVSSGGMYSEPLAVDRLEMPASAYDGVTAYARAKRAQVTLTELLDERLRDRGVVVQSMHPGWADTPGVARSLPTFRRVVGPLLRTPDGAADTLVWLASADGAPLQQPGRFWHDRRPRPTHRLAKTRRADTPSERQRLWDWVVAKSGATV